MTRTVNVTKCPRCGEPHCGMAMQPLGSPDTAANHWGSCLRTGEPVLVWLDPLPPKMPLLDMGCPIFALSTDGHWNHRQMRKLEAWCQSKMLVDFVVSAFIVHRGRVLLVEHKKLGLWMPPGGHIEPGELPDEALAREIREETGLILGETCYNVIRPAPVQSHLGAKKDATPGPHNRRPQIPVWTIEAHDYPPIPGHRHVALVYLLRATTNDVKLEEKSADGIGFFLPNVLPSPILESVEIYCQDAAVAAAGDIIPEGNV